MLQVSVANVRRPRRYQDGCCCRHLHLSPGRTAKFHFSGEKFISHRKTNSFYQEKKPQPFDHSVWCFQFVACRDLCPLSCIWNKAFLIERLHYWFKVFQVVEDLLGPDRSCSKVCFFLPFLQNAILFSFCLSSPTTTPLAMPGTWLPIV